MKFFIYTFLITMTALAAIAAAASTTLPTTMHTVSTAPTTNPYEALRGMTSNYLVLTQRSIFKKGAQDVDPFADTSAPVTPPPIIHTVAESSLEFNGATRADNNRAAFFENTSTHEVLMRHAGDALARGKILNITLDSIDYLADGRTSTIMIGQTLDGSAGPGLASAPSLSLSSTQPTANFTGPNADVLERLRQKRLKELGQ
jgi:hypothetical protein